MKRKKNRVSITINFAESDEFICQGKTPDKKPSEENDNVKGFDVRLSVIFDTYRNCARNLNYTH